MKKVKIALLDSGIDIHNSFFMNYVYQSKSFFRDGEKVYSNEKIDDDNGHGSLCASTILKECKEVEFYIAKIMNQKGLIDISVLEYILERLLYEDINIVCMSLSIVKGKHSRWLAQLCTQLCYKGVVVICSISNGRNRSYPANFKGVYAVRGFVLSDENEIWERKHGQEFVVDCNPYLHQSIGKKYELFGKSNSYACAKMCGIIAKTMIEHNCFENKDIRKILINISKKHGWINFIDLKKSKRFPKFKKETDVIDQRILEFLSREFNKPEEVFHIHSMFDDSIGLKYKECGILLKKLESYFHIEIDNYESISRYDFYSIYAIADMIERNQ